MANRQCARNRSVVHAKSPMIRHHVSPHLLELNVWTLVYLHENIQILSVLNHLR